MGSQTAQQIIKAFTQNNMTSQYKIRPPLQLLTYIMNWIERVVLSFLIPCVLTLVTSYCLCYCPCFFFFFPPIICWKFWDANSKDTFFSWFIQVGNWASDNDKNRISGLLYVIRSLGLLRIWHGTYRFLTLVLYRRGFWEQTQNLPPWCLKENPVTYPAE